VAGTEGQLMSIDLLAAAGEHFATVLSQTTPAQWTQPSPCEEWTVGDVADHVSGGNRWSVLVLAGTEPGPALQQVRSSGLGVDRPAEYPVTQQAQLAAFTAETDLSRTVNHLIGPVSVGRFVQIRMLDLTVHSWDLARGIGADETLPEPLVQACLHQLEGMGPKVALSGMFGSGAENAGPAATAQQRMLHLSGRRP
jgi:uncharacterized protein (TIGR03086 family)